MYQRDISKVLLNELDSKMVIILYGARQVGKTTLLKQLLGNQDAVIINCEKPSVSEALESRNFSKIKFLFGDYKIVALDEAQKVEDIGNILKLIYDDESMNYKIIATGSSSFELAGKIVEPLTGRNRKLKLFPFSLSELIKAKGSTWIEENLEEVLIFGSYPGIVDLSIQRKSLMLDELTSDYLYKDVLIHERIKNPALLRKLLKAVALQIGSQVSINELAGLLGISSQTVEKYLDLLEKCFVIYKLGSYSTNLRNEIKKNRKYFFVDLGIRNTILNNHSSLDSRQDIGMLWENFCINERIKFNNANQRIVNYYFWRTYDGAEIDLIEESGGKLKAFEFKWKSGKTGKLPYLFENKYGSIEYVTISKNEIYKLVE